MKKIIAWLIGVVIIIIIGLIGYVLIEKQLKQIMHLSYYKTTKSENTSPIYKISFL
jgi:uncharacterized protein YacL